ncbi:MAG TPA: uridine kinase [Bdellovibrionales bacterium]|nr:uridine kinase [Bdellovibrionales bacterium]
MKKPYLLGVAGGSGSGKTYFAQALVKELGEDVCEVVYQDNFYIDQSHRFDHDGGAVNFDHPDSIDFALLAEKLKALKTGAHIDIPIYDFKTHTRSPKTLPIQAKPVVIVDGILIFHSAPVRVLFDDLIFFETSEELRYQRRLERDVRERGRTPEGVRSQFLKQVKPMHDQFVAPSKAFAKTIVEDVGQFTDILNEVCRRLR